MKGFGSKVTEILRTEGAASVVDRTQRYLRYRLKRARVDPRPAIEDWESLRGSCQGRRAFVLGNGPSLNQTELHLLRDEVTMCFNRFDLMLERLHWVPTYYTTIDDRVLEDTLDVANEMSRLVDHAFFPDIHPYCVDFRDGLVKRPNVHWLFLDRASFSDELPYCGINKTVANVGLQILAFLGFTELNLIGMDMTYSLPAGAVVDGSRDVTSTADDDESHFDPRYFGKGRRFHVPLLDETFAKFREARGFFEERGVRIRNATVGGALEEFPRVAMNDILGFDDDRRSQLFVETVEGKMVRPGLDVLDAVKSARELGAEDPVPDRCEVFRVPAARASRVIHDRIFDFVPFGPFEGNTLFVRRRLLRSS